MDEYQKQLEVQRQNREREDRERREREERDRQEAARRQAWTDQQRGQPFAPRF